MTAMSDSKILMRMMDNHDPFTDKPLVLPILMVLIPFNGLRTRLRVNIKWCHFDITSYDTEWEE